MNKERTNATLVPSDKLAEMRLEIARLKAELAASPLKRLQTVTAERDALREQVRVLSEALPNDIRELGWSVAVHNDYRLAGVAHTFWLFTNGGNCVKGEGKTDEEALNQVRAALAAVKGEKA